MTEGNRSSFGNQLKKAVRAALFMAAIALLVWLLDRIGWQTIGDAFVRVGLGGVAVLLLVALAENVFQAAALGVLIRPRVSLLKLLAINGAGTVTNAVIPWEAGEILKGALMKDLAPPQTVIHSLVVWNYLLKLTGPAAGLLATLVAFALGHGIEQGVALVVLLANLAAFAPYFGLRFLLRLGAASLVIQLLKRLRLLRKDPEALLESARELDARIRHFRKERPADFRNAILYQFLSRLVSWSSWYIILSLLGTGYSFALCSIIFSGYAVSVYIVAFIPAKIGINEGAGYLLFTLYGLDGGIGLIATVIGRVKNLLTNGIAGLFVFFMRRPKGNRPALPSAPTASANEAVRKPSQEEDS